MPLDIFIHIGPPKTGTSAIQKWLKDNAELLSKNGIFYPQHSEDSNGISSGNFLSVFEPFEDDYRFCTARLETVIADVVAAGCHTLLLSSEYFFSRLTEVITVVPDIKCIAYVRNPAELHESHYNQSIKRHGNVDLIRRAPALPMQAFKVLEEYADLLGERLVLRPYHDALFTGGNIVTDFLDALGVSEIVTVANDDVRRINRSYSLEALEVKRCFNRYDLGLLANQLDRILQAYSGGINDFTFIDRNQFNDYKRQSIRWVERLSEQTAFVNGQSLIDLIRGQEHQPFYRQEITAEQCRDVLIFIGQSDPDFLKQLAFCVYAQPNVEDKSPFVETLFSCVPPKVALPSLRHFCRMAIAKPVGSLLESIDIPVESESSARDIKLIKFRLLAQLITHRRFNLLAYGKAFLMSH